MRVIRRLRNAATYLRVVALFVLVESLIRWVSLPRMTALMRVRLDLRSADPSAEMASRIALSYRAERRLTYTWRVAARWPFGAGPCLRRSLVAAHLLRSSGATLRLGFPRGPRESVAHAWIEIERRPLENVSAFEPFTHTLAGSR